MGGFTAVVGGNETYPESRVLIIITGGTICMQPSEGGLVPVDGFLESAMAPRPSFNDKSERGKFIERMRSLDASLLV